MPRNLQAWFFKLANRVPIYRLFLTIFLWFWVTSWAIVAIMLLGNHLTGLKQVSDPMYATVAPILAAEAVKVYESGGPEAFSRFSQSRNDDRARKLFLLDRFYEDVLGRAVTDDEIRVAHAAKDGQLVLLRRNMAHKFVSSHLVVSSTNPYIELTLLYRARPLLSAHSIHRPSGHDCFTGHVWVSCFWSA